MVPRQYVALCVLTFLGAPVLAEGFDPWGQSARYELEYRVDLGPWAGAKPGSVRMWMPLPADNNHQRVRSTKIESPWPHRETRDSHGNRFVYIEPGTNETGAAEVVVRCAVERFPVLKPEKPEGPPGTSPDPQRYLGPQRRIPLGGRIRTLADQESRGLRTDAHTIRAFYDYVLRTMRYSKHGEGWGRGDALWACDARYGNCTDFHSLFIGMARSQGIPARFVIGFPIPVEKEEAEIGGYHCWAEAYDRIRGWLPVDASEAWKSKRFDDYFGRIPSDRIEFTVGRDLLLEPRQQGEPLNFFIYPYVEADGQPVNNVGWKVHVRRLSASKDGD